MRKSFLMLALAGVLVMGVPAAVDLTFEADDTNTLQYPTFSGTTGNITGGDFASTEQTTTEAANDILNPVDGTQGTQSYKTTLAFDFDNWSWSDPLEADRCRVRITDFSDRHVISEPDASGGIGIYLLYDGAAGDFEVGISVREEPVNTGGNEVYETTTFQVLSGSPDWQYLYFPFSTIVSGPDNWGQAIALGDGVYDGGLAGSAPLYEAVMLRPIAGTTQAGVVFSLFIDDIHSGAEHTPLGTTPPAAAFDPPFQYIGALPANGRPLALAGDSSGGLYYATFNAQGAASGEAGYYIADPVAEVGDLDASDHVQFGSAEGAGFPVGRGWQGIGVGTSGEVFLSGDNGTVGVLARYGPAPTFTADATFNANAVTNAANRFGGLALMADTTIAVSTFNSINYFAAADADISAYTNAGGGVNYQREALYNAADDVLYATRNGNSDDALIAGYYSGGSVGGGNYTWTASELIPDGAINTAFGTSTGHGYIDNSVSPPRLYTVDTQSTAAGQSDPVVRIWDIDAGGTSLTLVGSVDVLTLASAGDIADCVRVGDTLYVSSTGDEAIYAFQPIVNTPVADYELYR